MFLIVGLGNPGKEYSQTRHNVGFLAVDALAASLGVAEFKLKKQCHAYLAETRFHGHKVILAQPQTFMNESGLAVAELLLWYKIEPSHLLVIYDDLDLPVGEVRIREKGSSAGHHGIESIFQYLKQHSFTRVRIGIGRDARMGGADYVLSKIPAEEREQIDAAIGEAVEKIKERLSAQ